MNKVLSIGLVLLWASVSIANDPNSTLPPRWALGLPKPDCQCSSGGQCTCDPATCACPACPKHKGGSEESEPVQRKFHTEYRQVCDPATQTCRMVAVSVPDAEESHAPPSLPVAQASCVSCQAAPQAYSSGEGSVASEGRRQPVRRIFGRIFRRGGGRRSGGCCGG